LVSSTNYDLKEYKYEFYTSNVKYKKKQDSEIPNNKSHVILKHAIVY